MAKAPRDQSLPFLIESWVGGQLAESYVLPINPSAYNHQRDPRASTTYTKGGAWEDLQGMGFAKIQLEGTFGYRGSLPGGPVPPERVRGGVQMCAWELFKDLESTLFGFYDRFGADAPAPPQGTELRFYNFTDEHFYKVQQTRFELKRSVSHRFLYRYSLHLLGLEPLLAPKVSPTDPLREALSMVVEPDTDRISWWKSALNGYTWVSNGISDTINYLDDLESDLRTIQQSVAAFRSGLSDFIDAPFELVSSAIDTVETVLGVVASLDSLPFEFTAALRDTKRDLFSLKIRADRFREPGAVSFESSAPASGRTEILTGPLPTGAWVDAVTMNNPETTLFGEIDGAEDVAAAEVAVRDGETLHSLAEKHLGSASEWQRIALLNDLEYPYELAAGDKVKIPGALESRATLVGTSENFEVQVYGIDEELDGDGDHRATNTGDVRTVSGLGNLAMQLQHRLSTLRGELAELGHPTYGCLLPTFIGKLGTDLWYERARVEVAQALLEDPRVESVSNVSFTVEGTAVYIEGDVLPINRTTPARLVLPLRAS